MALAGRNAAIRVMSDVSTPFTNAAMDQLDIDGREWEITNRAHRYWSRTAALTVEVFDTGTSTWVAAPARTRVAHAGGRVYFVDPQDDVRVSGQFVTTTAALEVQEYSVTLNADLIDVTNFSSQGWREKIQGIRDANGNLSGFYNANNLLTDRLLDAESLVVELDVADDDPTGEELYFYARLNSDELQAAVEGAVGASVSWESDGEVSIELKP